VYQETIDSVVTIRVSGVGGGQGSGWVYDDRHVVTNQHVVGDAPEAVVEFTNEQWTDGTVVGTDAYSDLAVLRVSSMPDRARALPLAAGDPPIGTPVVALGTPFGRESSVSAGIVSGVDRTLPARNNFSIPDAIQTDAPVNPGKSGGPLVDLDGTVVAVINSGQRTLAFGISAALTRRVVPELITSGEYRHALMGVQLRTVVPPIAEANDLDRSSGVLVVEVRPDGPSAGVLRGSESADGVPAGGDVIVAMDGQRIPLLGALSSFLALNTRPGDTIPVTVIRDGERTTVDLTLGVRPPP
jgi:S1-C subfamily serine protease